MENQPTLNRRRVLELSGVGTGLAISGCMDTSGIDFDGDRGELEDNERRVTMTLGISNEQIQEFQQRVDELQQQLDNEEITQEEFESQIEETQQQIIDESFDAVGEAFAEFDLTVEDRVTGQQPAMLVAGPVTDLIDALETDAADMIGSESFFEDLQQPVQQPPVEEEPAE